MAACATNQPSDKGQAVSMIKEAEGNTGAVPKEVSADAGYYSAKAVDELCRGRSARDCRSVALPGSWASTALS